MADEQCVQVPLLYSKRLKLDPTTPPHPHNSFLSVTVTFLCPEVAVVVSFDCIRVVPHSGIWRNCLYFHCHADVFC